MTPGIVPMIAPDGSSGDIPANRAQDAINAGFKPAVVMTAPDGSMGYIPRDRAGDAIKAGFKVGQPAAIRAEQGPQKTGVLDTITGVGKKLGQMAAGFMQTANPGALTNPGATAMTAAEMGQQATEAYQQTPQDSSGRAYDLLRQANPMIPLPSERTAMVAGSLLGADTPAMANAIKRGDVGGAVVESTPLLATAAAPEVIRRAGNIVPNRPPLQGALADRMAEVPAGSQFSRGEILDAARAHDVNLDVAQATDSPVAGAAKQANRLSLTGQPAYEQNLSRNMNALEEWANTEMEKYSPEGSSREALGGQAQAALAEDLQMRKTAAATAFEDLDKRVGANSIDGTNTVEAEARDIIGEMQGYYAKHPELKPKQAWGILENLAERPQIEVEGKPTTGPAGATIKGEPEMVDAPTHDFSWGELHQLRSDLMDVYRNNPDVIKGKSQGWLQRMVSTIDQTMTDSAQSGLTPDDLEQFRHANSLWEGLKETYDNPQSPLYHAMRTPFPSQVPQMLTKGAPELARQVQTTLGNLQGPMQRWYVEQLINDKNGNLDLGRLNQRLKTIPGDQLEAMIGPDGARNLQMLGKVAQKVLADVNPSGTAKVGQKVMEGGAILTHPIVGGVELGAQYAGAKAMNSPAVVDYLTKRPPVRGTVTPPSNNLGILMSLGGAARKRK